MTTTDQEKMAAAFSKILTLDSLEAPLLPSACDGHHALVDMGSNGIRFSVSDLTEPRARLLRCLYQERAPISLFDSLTQGQEGLLFPEDTIRLVALTVARFRRIAVDHYGVPLSQFTVFATEAMRRAQNAPAMLKAIHAAANAGAASDSELSPVLVLAPEVETLFGAVGARSSFVDVKGLFLDLGGGSVQMSYMDTFAASQHAGPDLGQELAHLLHEKTAASAGQSLPFGAARLIQIIGTSSDQQQAAATPHGQVAGAAAAAAAAELEGLRSGMREAFDNLRRRFPSLAETVDGSLHGGGGQQPGLDIYLCGGGFRGYGSMLMHDDPIQPYPVPAIGTYTTSGKRFGRTKDMLRLNSDHKGKIFGMSKRRRAQFPAVVAVVDALIAAVPIPIRSATFCAGGNREGALMAKLPRSVHDSNPLVLLASGEATLSPIPASAVADDSATEQAIFHILRSALPSDLAPLLTSTPSSVLGIRGLDSLFVHQIWTGMGGKDEVNATAVLHSALTQDPGCPGLTHQARALLALTLCARWGATLAPVDRQLHRNLQALAERGASLGEVAFWADYIGAAAAAVARVVPAWPSARPNVQRDISFHVTTQQGKNKLKIFLDIILGGDNAGVDAAPLIGLFKHVKSDEKTVHVTVKNSAPQKGT